MKPFLWPTNHQPILEKQVFEVIKMIIEMKRILIISVIIDIISGLPKIINKAKDLERVNHPRDQCALNWIT